MASARPTRVLVVANRTAATPELLDEIGRRSRVRPCEFFLLIPGVGEGRNPDWTSEDALALLERAAHAQVENLVGATDALASIEHAVAEREIDEIIVSTVPAHLAHLLRRDLAQRVEELGLPVTVIAREAKPRGMSFREFVETPGPIGGHGSMGGF